MNMERTRIPVKDLRAGDLIRQVYAPHPEWSKENKEKEAVRTVVVGTARPASLLYGEAVHSVVRVTGLDVEANRPVAWVAVPDQFVTVIR